MRSAHHCVHPFQETIEQRRRQSGWPRPGRVGRGVTIDDGRPTAILAYTVKGYGLAGRGHPQNHSSPLTGHQMREPAARLDADLDDPWRSFPDGSAAAERVSDPQPRRQLDHQPGWVNQVGVCPPPNTPTGSLTTPKRSCTGDKNRPASTSNSGPRGAAGVSRCYRSECSTTHSLSARWNHGATTSTRAANPSSSAPRPA